MSNRSLLIRNMKRGELDQIIDWAADEGWNPGLHDADVFWAADPDGFIVAEKDGHLIGGGSIVSYEGRFGFMGLFIMHPEHRGKGLGGQLWHQRLKRLIQRLNSPPLIGMDGVFNMQDWYSQGGFRFVARDLRYEGIAQSHGPSGVTVDVSDAPFSLLDDYDAAHFPARRSRFLQNWIRYPGSIGKAVFSDNKLQAYGLIRPCREGFKVGPLFADDLSLASHVFHDLSSCVPGEKIFLDVPEDNPAALTLVQTEDMREVFGCARMYYGEAPRLPIHEVFGVTTFELG